jgi:2,4-dienoyl-CoA reductase-like NADH-dependent reductase (Old Yellow Enzyme family)
MCQYSALDGLANEWHFVHQATRAVGGAGLVFTEATAVTAEGRISPQDVGLWNDAQVEPLARIVRFIDAQGSVAGLQLAHAGRKASMLRPWDGGGIATESADGWSDVVAPSALPFADDYSHPRALGDAEIIVLVAAFAAAARRALDAKYRVLEIHAAHGYLLHEFLSPLSNRRSDRWGGSFENRTRLVREVVDAVRRVWPESLPLVVRVSATDWTAGGWDVEQTVQLARDLKQRGVDLMDCSSGGNVAHAKIPVGPGYQTAFAERIRREAGIATGAVGIIVDPSQADHVIRSGQADLVLLARELLRDPYWPLRAARELGQPVPWPAQYLRAAPRGSPARPSPEAIRR